MFQWVFERMTKDTTLTASSTMKIMVVAPPNGNIFTVGAKRFRCAEVLPTEAYCLFTSKVGPTDQFDWLMDKIVGLFTSSLDSYSEKVEVLEHFLPVGVLSGRTCMPGCQRSHLRLNRAIPDVSIVHARMSQLSLVTERVSPETDFVQRYWNSPAMHDAVPAQHEPLLIHGGVRS